MRKVASLCCVAAVLAVSTTASAADVTPLFPGTAGASTAVASSFDHHEDGKGGKLAEPQHQPIPLYHRVKIEDPDHIHPCAVPKIVKVLDPCWRPCGCCKPRCVFVKICVPPPHCHHPKPSCCAPAPCHHHGHGPRVTCEDGGAYVKYDYGKYRIEITSEDGWIEVDYDD